MSAPLPAISPLTTGQIVAIGGASFEQPMRAHDEALYRYLIALTGKDQPNDQRSERPRVCFLPTASGESLPYIVNFYETFTALDTVPSHLSFFKPPTADLRGYLLQQHLIYVGGGNTKSMLALWREWGVDAILREACERGIILAGLSAGSICWFEQGITDSIPGPLTPLPCLGFLRGSNCPHYDSEAQRRPTFHALLASGQIAAGHAAEDGVALHYINGQLARIVSSRSGKRAYALEVRDGQASETMLEAEYLNA